MPAIVKLPSPLHGPAQTAVPPPTARLFDSFRPMRHSLTAFGCRLEWQGRALAYSGDTDVCDGIVELGRAAVEAGETTGVAYFEWSAEVDTDGTHYRAYRLYLSTAGAPSFAWTFGDGTTGSGAQPRHVYARPGTYTVTLAVTDAAGNAGGDSKTITVVNGVMAGNYQPVEAPRDGKLAALFVAVTVSASAAARPGPTGRGVRPRCR